MTNPLWITYSWADNEEGDFDYLVQELEKAGIPALYDKIALGLGKDTVSCQSIGKCGHLELLTLTA